jgi:DNA-binding response OmpR family regulator
MNHSPVILLIDDNDQDRKIMTRLLLRSGRGEPIEARTAREAEAAAAANTIDVAIVDTVLPDAQGFEVCARIRALHPSAKIIMITGLIDALDAGRARKAGADDYVVKTADGAPLLEALAAALGDGR